MKNYLSKKRKIKPWAYAVFIAIVAHLIFMLILFSPANVEKFQQTSNKVIMLPCKNEGGNKVQAYKTNTQ